MTLSLLNEFVIVRRKRGLRDLTELRRFARGGRGCTSPLFLLSFDACSFPEFSVLDQNVELVANSNEPRIVGALTDDTPDERSSRSVPRIVGALNERSSRSFSRTVGALTKRFSRSFPRIVGALTG